MRRLRTGLAYGVVAMLFYVAVRGSAAAWAPWEAVGFSLGWAARCGAQALDAPGYHLLDHWQGTNWAPNHPDEAALVAVGLPMAALFMLGFLVGLARGPRVRPPVKGGRILDDRAPDTIALEGRTGRSLARIALALALAGAAAYGFVVGFVAVVVALQARRHLGRRVRGRGWAALAIVLGTLEALAWMVVLVTRWHPKEI